MSIIGGRVAPFKSIYGSQLSKCLNIKKLQRKVAIQKRSSVLLPWQTYLYGRVRGQGGIYIFQAPQS